MTWKHAIRRAMARACHIPRGSSAIRRRPPLLDQERFRRRSTFLVWLYRHVVVVQLACVAGGCAARRSDSTPPPVQAADSVSPRARLADPIPPSDRAVRSALPPVGVGQTVPPPMRVTPADPYVETVRRFDRGVFFKPREPVPAGIPPELAPLIVHEVFDDDVSGNAAHRFGAVHVDPAGAAAVDVERPTMYVDETSIAIHGQPHDEMLFVWWYAVPPRGTTAQGRRKSCRPAGRGVRVTMGLDGFPMMWEVLSTGTVGDAERRSRVVFVSRGLEDAARDAFGPPLDGRRFSVEPSAAAHPDVMVAGVLEDGPVPMGPTVYVAAETHGITAVICRCMPARVDVLVASVVYDLVPLEWLVAAGLDVLLGVDAATLAPPGRARGPVAGCLRVPEGF